MAYRGVAHVTMPVDMQSMPCSADARSERNIPNHVSMVMAESAHVPDEAHLRRAAEVLNAGKKVTILAGRGALGASRELAQIADLLAAPVGKPLLGKGTLADDHAHSVGGVGLLGTKAGQDALEGCDTLLIVGSSFPYIEFYPKPGQARAVQIEIDPKRMGLRYPVEAPLVGDSRTVLSRLMPMLERKDDRRFLEAMQTEMTAWRATMRERGTRTDSPMKPQVVAHELNKLLHNDAIVATDSGTITTWVARHVDMRGDMMFACSGNLATMGCGLPYAVAAAVAHPGRQVVAMVGDGGLTMLMGELATCVKYKLDVKIIVIKNNTLGQIKWEQMVFLGNPEFGCDLQPIDFVGIARACGAQGYSIEDPAECAATLKQALSTPGPVLIEAVVDPNEPPMPPRATLRQVAHLAESLARGTPDRGRVARTIAGDVIRELV
jgi:pyruvate dehydrogenase (quinone)/pyruvate oxidase